MVISHGDGQDVYMGRWTYHNRVVSIRYRLVSVTVESVPPQKLPGSLQEGTVKAYGDRTLTDQKRAKPLIVFATPAFAFFGAVVMFDFTASSVTGRISSGLNVTPGSPGFSG